MKIIWLPCLNISQLFLYRFVIERLSMQSLHNFGMRLSLVLERKTSLAISKFLVKRSLIISDVSYLNPTVHVQYTCRDLDLLLVPSSYSSDPNLKIMSEQWPPFLLASKVTFCCPVDESGCDIFSKN